MQGVSKRLNKSQRVTTMPLRCESAAALKVYRMWYLMVPYPGIYILVTTQTDRQPRAFERAHKQWLGHNTHGS